MAQINAHMKDNAVRLFFNEEIKTGREPHLSGKVQVEGKRYIPPTLSQPGRVYAITTVNNVNYIEEQPIQLHEMYRPSELPPPVYRRARSRSRS